MSNSANSVNSWSVRNDVAPRPIVSTARHRHINQSRVPLLNRFPIETPSVQNSGAVILDQNVTILDQPADGLERIRMFHVESSAAFSATPDEVVGVVGSVH